jgi:hypothetical protein
MTLSPKAEMVFLVASGEPARRAGDAGLVGDAARTGRASILATDARITRMSALKRSSVRTIA